MAHTLFLQHTKMFNLDDITNEHDDEHSLKWPCIPDHPYRMLIIGSLGSGKTFKRCMLNLIKERDSDNLNDKICLYSKDLNETKYQLLIKRLESAGIKYLNDSKTFIEYPTYMNNVYHNINDYNLARKRKFFMYMMT